MTLVARRTAKLIRDASIADQMATLINQRALREITPDEYILRSAVICNDQVDYYLTQFTLEALKKIASLMPGKKLMRNHNTWESEDLPVGTWLDARVVKERGVNNVVATFFMMKAGDTDGLIPRIDAGHIDEMSLSWYPLGNCCSICGNSLSSMDCEHAPGKEYSGKMCVMSMPDLRDVIECSLVWKGGQKGTTIAMPRTFDGEELEELDAAMKRFATKGLPAEPGLDELEQLLRSGNADPDEIEALLRNDAGASTAADEDDLARLFEREEEDPGIESLLSQG